MQRGDGQETRSRRALEALAGAIVESLWQREVQLPDGDVRPDAEMEQGQRNPVPPSNRPSHKEADDGNH
jgi:hypothetical protein